MKTSLGEVDASPDPCMPAMAIIVMSGKVVFAQAVTGKAEGEAILRDMLGRHEQFTIEKGHL